MASGINPVIVLLKLPAPVPFVVILFAVVGLPAVFQHIPRTVTAAVPDEVTLPPQVALVESILLTLAVFTTGGT
jgi:hypothetical protein